MDMSEYCVTWDSQSENSSQSMPLGGFDMGCNVWVENNSLYVYVSESGAFDENNTLLKLARLRVSVADGAELLSENFRQTLSPGDGSIAISAGHGGDSVELRLWAAVTKPELHIDCSSESPHKWEVSLESWRFRRREVTSGEQNQCRDRGFALGTDTNGIYTEPDHAEPDADSLVFYHRNADETVWEKLIAQQHLEPVRDAIPNPLLHRTAGGVMRMSGGEYSGERCGEYAGTDFKGYVYLSARAATDCNISLTLLTGCFDSVGDWKSALYSRESERVSRGESEAWWREYFNRSYISAGADGSDWFMYSKNYQLFRYMLGCNFRGEYPTKFNGGLFTFDAGHTPDYRMWSGGGFTSQNQRLVYWGMLKCGDFDGMLPQLEFFRRLTVAARARVRRFFGFDGAFFFEQGNLFGLCTGGEYDYDRPAGLPEAFEGSPWVRLHWSTGLEFALMMLEYSRYSGRPIPEYLDYIDGVISFYFNYYGAGEDGKLRIFPSTALETYKGPDPRSGDINKNGCEDPTDAVAGLRCALGELIEYLRSRGDSDAETRVFREKLPEYERRLAMCPEIPVAEDESGRKYFLPARKYDPKPFNCELPELYRVFPYSPRGLSPDEYDAGRNTCLRPSASADIDLGCSWHQNGIFAARLGLYEKAMKYLAIKLGDGPFRFPAFWGPGHDWMPDHNHGGTGMIELQELLLRCEGGKIVLLPCWDKRVDVSFRLCAPESTTVECVWKDGALESLEVTPPERLSDVVISDFSV